MFGLGTIINTACIIVGGIIGGLIGSKIPERVQESVHMACGISTVFIGIAGAMSGMLKMMDGGLSSQNTMMVVISIVLGSIIGEIINLEKYIERFGTWIRNKTGNQSDNSFVNGFVTASLVVCIGAMAIVGSITDGITGDYSILLTKGILDLVIVMVMSCSLGKGCAFSAIPVFIFQGTITLLAQLIKPYITDGAMANISLIGSILIFCVGLNLVFEKSVRVRVANYLPALIVAVIFSLF